MPILDPNERKRLPLPLGVTTGVGNYTAGTPIVSRSAQGRVPVGPSRVDLSSTPGLQKILQPAPPSTGRYVQSNVGRNRQPVLAPPAGATGISVIPDVQARPLTMPQAPISTPTQPDLAGQYDAVRANLAAGATGEEAGRSARQGIPFSAPVGGAAVQGGNPLYENLQGPAVAPALASTEPGTAVLSGRFAGQTAPETRSYTKAGVADATSRLNVVPGLFNGPSPESEAALREARTAAEARGDYAAVERSYQSPAERAQADVTKAEGRLLKRLPGLPAAQVPAALTSLDGQRKPLTFDQVKAARAAQLGQGEPTAADKLLFGQRTAPLAQPRVYTRKSVDEAGTETNLPYTLDAQGNAVPVKFPGAPGQGQPAPQPLPEGHTPESARANAVAIAKQTPARLAEINQLLQGYGLPPIAEADLR